MVKVNLTRRLSELDSLLGAEQDIVRGADAILGYLNGLYPDSNRLPEKDMLDVAASCVGIVLGLKQGLRDPGFQPRVGILEKKVEYGHLGLANVSFNLLSAIRKIAENKPGLRKKIEAQWEDMSALLPKWAERRKVYSGRREAAKDDILRFVTERTAKERAALINQALDQNDENAELLLVLEGRVSRVFCVESDSKGNKRVKTRNLSRVILDDLNDAAMQVIRKNGIDPAVKQAAFNITEVTAEAVKLHEVLASEIPVYNIGLATTHPNQYFQNLRRQRAA